jgi:hypothetical protein
VRARLLRSQSRGPVAHLVERRHGMAKVVGSIPIGSTAARRRAPALRGNRFDPGREKSRPEPFFLKPSTTGADYLIGQQNSWVVFYWGLDVGSW